MKFVLHIDMIETEGDKTGKQNRGCKILKLEMGKSDFLGLESKSESFIVESKPTSFSNMEPKFDFASKVNEYSFGLIFHIRCNMLVELQPPRQ